ncbi:hypothetical protein [Tranquillimonas alkanivorans]|uniref:Uncharacterized protein n=1 Tax=Tranquillimonas alkanivorans TaxID=441119 RepID=A0A1I5WP46_9RHOB|nr:hypothetical protein [Tranquillimonas alkanivorans]SFQ21563.1 hypothetical protein SAMN04488047_1526 [Tranquillimonas alkanivorans]
MSTHALRAWKAQSSLLEARAENLKKDALLSIAHHPLAVMLRLTSQDITEDVGLKQPRRTPAFKLVGEHFTSKGEKIRFSVAPKIGAGKILSRCDFVKEPTANIFLSASGVLGLGQTYRMKHVSSDVYQTMDPEGLVKAVLQPHVVSQHAGHPAKQYWILSLEYCHFR